MDGAELKHLLEGAPIDQQIVERLLTSLGYTIMPATEQPLDLDSLLQAKEMRERIHSSKKLFSMRAPWVHPISKQQFDREAAIILFEVKDENTLRSKILFDITRYVVRFSMLASQGLFFFFAPNSKTLVITAYTQSMQAVDQVQVRRLVIDTSNIARTDIDSIIELDELPEYPSAIVEAFRRALPYLKVGRDFFRAYHDNFQLLSKKLARVLDSQMESYSFAQRFLGRVTFLYFLQRKGWLEGDKAYLKKLLTLGDGENVFNALYKLFDMMNEEDRDSNSKKRIPYLNGNLFERESYTKSQMKKIASACALVINDILQMFNQYNFTISESTLLNKEVAVDPELLGSIFESMLPDYERGDKGTFYTHQEEMLFMARESLRSYLRSFSHLNDDEIFFVVYGIDVSAKMEPKVAREIKELSKRVKILDPAVGSGGFMMASLQTLLEVRGRLNRIIGIVEPDYDAKLEIIENSLFGVDIEYEAIELARLRLWLTLVVDEPVENVRPLPNLDYNLHQGDSLIVPEFETMHQVKITMDPTVRTALVRQITAAREDYLRSHGKAKQAKKQELESALLKLLELETGSKPKFLPFSYKYFFADVLAQGGFDIILMNPPYVTQEEIGRLYSNDPAKYKAQVIEGMMSLTQNKFIPNKQSDMAVYFLVRAISLLKPKGTAVVIATSKWLDARYGVALQEYFLKYTFLDCVYDSVDRAFAADVNTAIIVIRKPSQAVMMDNVVRFIYFKTPYKVINGPIIRSCWQISESGSTATESFKITRRSQRQLLEDGLTILEQEEEEVSTQLLEKELGVIMDDKKKIYVGTKWGSLHIYAPDLYPLILQKGSSKLATIDSEYSMIRGVTTGVNDFFILKESPPHKSNEIIRLTNGFGIDVFLERKYCPPVLMRPEEDQPSEIKKGSIKLRLFRCREERSKLRGTYALKYITWAETSSDAFIEIRQGKDKGKRRRITELATMKSRAEWYMLPDIKPASVVAPQGIKNKQVVFYSKEPIHFEHRFYGLYTDSPLDLWLFLNSSIFRMFLELNGRVEGAGALGVMVYEYKKCPVLHPMPRISEKFYSLEKFRLRPQYRFVNIKEQGPLEFDQQDRIELDNIILQEIGFNDQKERKRLLDELYCWLREHVHHRLTKPETAPESVTKEIGRKRSNMDLREFQ